MKPSNPALAARLRKVRDDLFGEDGEWAMAEALSVPASAWRRYEAGARLPGVVLLVFLEFTGADPRWLLTGEGGPYLEANSRNAS